MDDEDFAAQHADQYIGCVACRASHHESAYCPCGQCFFCLMRTKPGAVEHTEHGTFVSCPCNRHILWD